MRPPSNIALWIQDILDRLAENDADITELNQSCRGMDDSTVMALTCALKQNTRLQKLVLSLNGIGPMGTRALAARLSKRNCSIEILELWDNRIRDGGAKALGGMLKCNKKLVSLHLAKNEIGPVGAKALANGLQKNESLCKLWLGRNRIGNKGAIFFGQMLKTNKHLILLNLYGNSIGPEGALGLATGLRHNGCLEALHLGYNEIGNEGAMAFAMMLQTNQTLKILHIWGNSIGDEGLASLATDGLCHNDCLEELGLGGVVLGSKGCKALGRALQENSRLKTLLLSGSCSDDADVIQYIANGLQYNTSLKKLRLVENSSGDEGYKALGRMIGINHGLEYLFLSNMDTGDAGVIALMQGVEKNHSLETLSVQGINIGNGSTRAIGAMLKTNETLKELHLNSTSIRDCRDLLDGLRDNYFLNKLVFDNNRFLMDMLGFNLALNTAGRRLLRQDRVPTTLWAHVLSRVSNEPSILYYFCCAKPDLFRMSP